MFIASNQFEVIKGREQAFEDAWLARRARLLEAPGLISVRFHRGGEKDGCVLYFTLTMWRTEESFLAWKTVELARDTLPRLDPPHAARSLH